MWRGSRGFGGQEIVIRIFCMKANYFQQKLAKRNEVDVYLFWSEKTFKYVVTFLMSSDEMPDIFFYISEVK